MYKLRFKEKFGKRIFVVFCFTYSEFKFYYDYYKHFYHIKISKNDTILFNCGYYDKLNLKWIDKLLVSFNVEQDKEILKMFRHIRLDFGADNIVLLGQKFMDNIIYKIDLLNKLRKEKDYNYLISIDGGINNETIEKVKDVDFAISGSFICMSDDYQEKINELRK